MSFIETITDDNLQDCYKQAYKAKKNKKTKELLTFQENLTENLFTLLQEVKTLTYKVSSYRKFTLKESNKERIIYAPSFRDCIVQRLIYNYINPIYEKCFIYHSYGTRKNKGMHKASKQLQNYFKQSDKEHYFIQLDIRKFFYSIDNNILQQIIKKKIKDKSLLNLIQQFNTPPKDSTIGLPLGNLLSQLFSNIYLNELDNYIKRELKIKKYIRYVDDFILVDIQTKEQANELKQKIESFLKEKLHLQLSKYKIDKIKNGTDFVGFRTWQHYRLLRKRTVRQFKNNIKKNKIISAVSQIGHSKDTLTEKHYIRYLLEREKYVSLPYKLRTRLIKQK